MSDSTSRVRIEIDSKGDFGAFETGAVKVDQLAQSIKTAQSALGALGFGVSAAAAVHFTESIISMAAEITNLSNRIGISVEAFQVLENVARQTGLGAAQLEAILAKLKDSIELAADRGGKAEKALEKLGLSAKVLAGVPLEKVLEAVAVAVQNATDKTKAYAAASDILGIRYLPKLEEVMHRVAGGYDDMAKAQKASGLIMEEENVKRLTGTYNAMGDALVKVKVLLGNFWGNVQAEHEKIFGNFLDAMHAASPAEHIELVRPEGRGKSLNSQNPRIAENSPFLPNPNKQSGTNFIGNDTSAAGLIALSGQMIRDNAETKENLELKKRITEEVKAQSGEYEKHIAANLKLIEKAEDLADPLKKDRDEIEAMRKAYAEAGISTETMEKAISKIREQMNDKALKEFFGGMDKEDHRRKTRLSDFEQSKKDYREGQSDDPNVNASAMTPSEGAQVALMDFATRIGSIGNQIRATFTNIAQSITGGITNGIMGLITRTQTWASALRNIGTSVIASVIQAIVDMGVRWVITHTLMAAAGKALATGAVAASIPIALAQSAVWSTPATLATIASYGGAAAAAPALIGAAELETLGLSLASEGGYFPGDPTKARGVFHGSEYIFSAPAVRDIGVENLEAMHSSRALIPAPSGSSSPAGGGGGFGSGGKPDRFVVIDHRDTVKISEIMADSNFNNHVRRIGRQDRGV